MNIGIGLPAAIPGVKGELILEWARRADSAAFSSLGGLDRGVYQNYEPLMTLAAGAGVAKGLRFLAPGVGAPRRGAGLLSPQAPRLGGRSHRPAALGPRGG